MYDPLRDKRGRRRSDAPPQKSDKPKPGGYVLSRGDLRILQVLHLCGGYLTTPILFRFLKREGTYVNIKSLQRRLKELRQEMRLIDWPSKQFSTINKSGKNPLVHKLNEGGVLALKKAGMWYKDAPSPRGFFEHQLLVSCAYACYWLEALEAGLEFIPQHLLKFKKIFVNGKRVRPDAMFIVYMEDGKPRLVFFEGDRDTEAGYSEDEEKQSWTRKVKQYKELISDGLYRQFVEVPDDCRAQLHAMTVSHLQKDRILKEISRFYPDKCMYIFVLATNDFGYVFKPPKNVATLSAVWVRHNADAFRFITPADQAVHN